MVELPSGLVRCPECHRWKQKRLFDKRESHKTKVQVYCKACLKRQNNATSLQRRERLFKMEAKERSNRILEAVAKRVIYKRAQKEKSTWSLSDLPILSNQNIGRQSSAIPT